MATIVSLDAFVSINGVDLSNRVKKATLDQKSEAQDNSAMGMTTRSRQGGLKDWTLTVEFEQDYAAGSVDATLFPLVGTTTAIEFRQVKTGGRTVTNPGYTGTGFVEDYKPGDATVGALSVATLKIVAAGDIARQTV